MAHLISSPSSLSSPLCSTEQPAEVASEEVKQVVDEPKEIVDAPVVAEEAAAPTNGSVVVPEPAVEEAPAQPEVVQAEEGSESVPATNGSSEAVEANGEAKETEAESVGEVTEEPVVSGDKRKSDVVAVEDAEKPDSTEVAAKKAKVDGEEVPEEAAPVVEASA